MSATKIHNKFVFECDDCADSIETDCEIFHEAHAFIKSNGWKTAKHGAHWQHFCPNCDGE